MIRLVINADDLGFHPRIDEGIFKAHREGLVTSASLLCTGPSAKSAVATAVAQKLPLGIHLCLTSRFTPAAPAHEVASVAPEGRFRERWPEVVSAWLRGQLSLDEVGREFQAQVARARVLGAEPDHLDGHQHLHMLPSFRKCVEALAQSQKLPLRWPYERPKRQWLKSPGAALKVLLLGAASSRPRVPSLRSVGVFEAGRLDEKRLIGLLRTLPDGDWEIGCHPGFHPGQVPEEPNWKYGWEDELSALCSPKARRVIEERGIQLTSYRALFSGRLMP